MKKIFKTIALTLIIACMAAPKILEADYYIPEPPFSVKRTIVKYAIEYGAKAEEINFVISDESKFECVPKGWNDGGKAYGPAQYHKDTFTGYAKKMGEKLDYKSCHDQIKLMAWQFAKIPSSKCEWTKWKNTYCTKKSA